MPIKDPEIRRMKHREYMRDVYLRDPEAYEKHKARVARVKKVARDESKVVIDSFRSDGCAVCSESEAACLDAHHLDAETKEFSIGKAMANGVPAYRIASELRNCVCLCANCHRKLHAGLITRDLSEYRGRGVPDVQRKKRGPTPK